jgi:ketosteroid isomerase-like protein
MSEENVEVIRQANEAFNEGGVPAARRFFAEDVEFHEPPEQPGPRKAKGRDAVEKLFGEFDEAWTEHRSELEEVRSLDDARVLVFSVERFRGRDGMEVAAPAGAIFTLREGKIVRWEAFWDRQRALEAAGLSE